MDDPFAADRFTVDLAEWGETTPSVAAEPARGPRGSTSSWRLLGRQLLVVALTLVVFRHSLVSLFRSIEHGSVLVYLLAVPLFAMLAGAAGRRRARPGTRVTALRVGIADVVVGVVLCGVALALTTLFGPDLSGVYAVWRLDLLMLWVFLLGAHVLAFGRRLVASAWAFWVVLLLVWPFPMRLVNAVTGSASGGSVALVLVVLGVLAYGHKRADHPRWQVLGSSAAAALVLLVTCDVATNPQRILWPSVAAAAVGACWWVSRSSGPAEGAIPERRVRGTIAYLVGLSVIGLVVLPPAPRPVAISVPVGITALATGPLEMAGWATMTSEQLAPQPFFGNQSTWQRVGFRQGVSGVGPEADGRDIVVDVITTPRPQTLDLYPVVTTYRMGTLSATPAAVVDLGHAVEGSFYRGTDPGRHLSYTLLTFSWRLPVDMSIVVPYHGPPAQLTQRMTLLAVDDHEPDAEFPQPGNATLDGFSTALAGLGPGSTSASSTLPADDTRLLAGAARALVDERLTGG